MQSSLVKIFPLTEIWFRFLRDCEAVAAPPDAVAVSRTDIFGGAGAGLWGVLLLRVDRGFRGEWLAGASAGCSFFSSPYMTDSFSGLSSRLNPLGFDFLNVGGGSFSWSRTEGSGGREGTLKAGCSRGPDDLEDTSDDAGVDFD